VKPRTASKSAAIIAGIVIGAGLLMTGCSGGTLDTSSASPAVDPRAFMACGLLSNAQNDASTAVYRYTIAPTSDKTAAAVAAETALGLGAGRARDAAPASLVAVFNDANDAVTAVVNLDDSHALYGVDVTTELQGALQAQYISVGSALRACVHAGVPVQVVSPDTGRTSQLAG